MTVLEKVSDSTPKHGVLLTGTLKEVGKWKFKGGHCNICAWFLTVSLSPSISMTPAYHIYTF